jgi:site-specific DNA recombinase
MMERIEQDGPFGILAWHPDRLARNSVDGGRVVYLVDTGKIAALRFPTFWCEPTPQGLFMLQVAFGQSKYYSDNLAENTRRGMRQKLRKGEWLAKAPFGYVNNPRTRNIEPDPVKSRIIVRAFEEYATGAHTYESLAQFLAEHNVTTKKGTPLGKASVSRLLENKAYLGLTKYKDEYFPGSFTPILSATLFEAVQEKLGEKGRPRYRRHVHQFPFTGLLHCGECESMITAQWATGKLGKRYRYYRCTKKRGVCTQAYLQEEALAEQIKERLQEVSLPDAWADKMLKRVETWEQEESHASGTRVMRLKDELKEVERKMDALVDLHLNGDIERESYLRKKDELLRQKLLLDEKLSAARRERKNRVEPLRKWILDSKRAGFLASSTKYAEMRDFVRSFGTNPALLDMTVSISFSSPSQLVSARKTDSHFAHAHLAAARERAAAYFGEVSDCDPTGNRTPLSTVRGSRPSR